MSIFLINPPFSTPDRPYISIPTLVGYLEGRQIPVEALDLNIEFFHSFLSAGNLRRSRQYAVDRLKTLNASGGLTLSESLEFLRTCRLLQQTKDRMQDLGSLFGSKRLPCHEKNALLPLALQLASLRAFPESLGVTENTKYIRYQSRFSHFSSREILEGLRRDLLFTKRVTRLLRQHLRGKSPTVLGISVTFADQIQPALLCARILRTMFPSAVLVLGGPFVTSHLQHAENPAIFEGIDGLVIGDGEIPLERIYLESLRPQPDLGRVPNLVYSREGRVCRTPRDPNLHSGLSQRPDYGVFPISRYMYRKEEVAIQFRLTQGCYWGRCTFCNTGEVKYQKPLAGQVYEDLRSVIRQTDTRMIHFTDDAVPFSLLDAISDRLLADGIRVRWGCNLRFDAALTLERLMKYREAGCYTIYFGLESAHPRVLKLMEKGIELGTVERILSDMSWTGIMANVYMIVGFPTETEEEAMVSFEWIQRFLASGLISTCTYSRFEITRPSPVSTDPARFSVTKINYQGHKDLRPPVPDFEAQGLGPQRAAALLGIFLQRLGDEREPGLPRSQPEAVTPAFPEGFGSLAFDLGTMREAVLQRLKATQAGIVDLVASDDGSIVTTRAADQQGRA